MLVLYLPIFCILPFFALRVNLIRTELKSRTRKKITKEKIVKTTCYVIHPCKSCNLILAHKIGVTTRRNVPTWKRGRLPPGTRTFTVISRIRLNGACIL